MLRIRPLLLTLAIIATAPTLWQRVRGQDGASPAPSASGEEKPIHYWVQQLGNDHFLRREKATKELIKAGPDAIDDLVGAIQTGDLEVIERATEVITEIALARSPRDDGGAWVALSKLAEHGAGRRASRAISALDEIRDHRASQARHALAAAGISVGMDEFAIRAISQPRMVVQIDEKWRGDVESLQWLEWLEDVENARVKGPAVTREVIEHVVTIPDLQTLAIVDGKVDEATLAPLVEMPRIHAIEFRYVSLSDEQGDLIASIPIRVSLNLMGTGISAEKVEAMCEALPGLQIDYRQGGFLGVTCMDNFDVCEINGVLPESAAEEAGLIKGDVIVRIGDAEVTRFKDLQNAINQHLPGDEVEVKFRRGDKIESVTLRLRRFEEK